MKVLTTLRLPSRVLYGEVQQFSYNVEVLENK